MSMHKGILGQSTGGASVNDGLRHEEKTISEYIARKQRNDAFNAVVKEKKLTFEEWYHKQGFYLDPSCQEYFHEFQLCWQAAQENKP